MPQLLWILPIAACSVVPAWAAAYRPAAYKPARTSDGHVEFEGIWKNPNLTPLERPTKEPHAILTTAQTAELTREYFNAAGTYRMIPVDYWKIVPTKRLAARFAAA